MNFLEFPKFFAWSVAHAASIISNQGTTFDQLDDYSLLNIFDLLEFTDLANVATLSERYKQLILHHEIITKYGANKAKFYASISSDDSEAEVSYINANNGTRIVLSKDHTNLFTILRTFCPIFGQLTISSDCANDDLLSKVADIVNTHCTNVPQEVIIFPY